MSCQKRIHADSPAGEAKSLRPSEPELIRASLAWDFDGFVSFYQFYRDQVRAHVNHTSRDVSELLIYGNDTTKKGQPLQTKNHLNRNGLPDEIGQSGK